LTSSKQTAALRAIFTGSLILAMGLTAPGMGARLISEDQINFFLLPPSSSQILSVMFRSY